MSVSPAKSPAPDSPRASQSPAPLGVQGDLEQELLGLANALYNLGTTVINDSTKDIPKPNGLPGQQGPPVKNVGLRVNEVIAHLSTLNQIAPHVRDTLVPIQALSDIDNSRNPFQITRERMERAAAENQFMNGKVRAVENYSNLLNQALAENFPELASYLPGPEESQDPQSLKTQSTMDVDNPSQLTNGTSYQPTQATATQP